MLLIGGCDKKISNDSPNSNSQKSESNKDAEASNKSIPKFTLACSTGGGQPWYRLVSDGNDIYYASIVNDNNIKATKKSFEVVTNDRLVNFKMKSGESDTEYLMELDRSNLIVSSKYFVSTTMYPPDGYSSMVLNCELIDDENLLTTLKSAYEYTLSETAEKKRQYDNRPNKI